MSDDPVTFGLQIGALFVIAGALISLWDAWTGGTVLAIGAGMTVVALVWAWRDR